MASEDKQTKNKDGGTYFDPVSTEILRVFEDATRRLDEAVKSFVETTNKTASFSIYQTAETAKWSKDDILKAWSDALDLVDKESALFAKAMKLFMVVTAPDNPKDHVAPERRKLKSDFPRLKIPGKGEWSENHKLALVTEAFVRTFPALRRLALAAMLPSFNVMLTAIAFPHEKQAYVLPKDRTWDSFFAIERAYRVPSDPANYREGLEMFFTHALKKNVQSAVWTLLFSMSQSKSVRRRMCKDVEFLDILTTDIQDRCDCWMRLHSRGIPRTSTSEILSELTLWIQLLVKVVNESPNEWVANVTSEDRRKKGLPVIWGNDPNLFKGGDPDSFLLKIDRLLDLADLDRYGKELETAIQVETTQLACLVRPDLKDLNFPLLATLPEKLADLSLSEKRKGEGAPVTCDFCRRPAPEDSKMKRCSRCKISWYCSSDCQKAAWKDHKANCFDVGGTTT